MSKETIITNKQKTCKRCKESKDASEYTTKQYVLLKSGESKSYLNPYCNGCRAANRDSARKKPWYRISVLFKLNQEDATYWYNRTEEACDICGKEWQEGSPRLCVDHDHNTGEIRGILCKPCNHVLGHAYDNIETLQNAILYLKQAGN